MEGELELYLKSNHINPYKFLGVRKGGTLNELKEAYSKKSKKISNKNLGDQLEMKILNDCFTYLQLKFSHRKQEEPEPLKTKEPEHFEVKRNFYKTNFDDPEIRQQLFVKSVTNLNTPLNEENVEKNKEEVGNYLPFKKMTNKKFNKMFEKLKSVEIQEKAEITPLDAGSSLEPTFVSFYKGLLVENPDYNTLNFADYEKIKKEEDIHTKIKKSKKVKKQDLPKEEPLEKLLNERKNQHITVSSTKSFAEGVADMAKIQKEMLKEEIERNREHVMNNIHIFSPATIEQFKNGTLEDSSTFIIE